MAKYLMLLISHLIGDFYLQTTKIADCKNARKGSDCGKCKKCKDSSWVNWRYLFIHSLLYVLPFLVLCLFMRGSVVTVVGVLLVTHILIDAIACYFNKRSKQTIVFVLDQALHVGIIYVISRFVTFRYNTGDSFYSIIKIFFVCLMLIMPCSIMISKMFKDIYIQSNDVGMFDIGSIIGVMERLLTFIFAYFESFPAIAIIITVKTWARTNDLKETEFRNKYLLGTLTSLVLALGVFIIYKSV